MNRSVLKCIASVAFTALVAGCASYRVLVSDPPAGVAVVGIEVKAAASDGGSCRVTRLKTENNACKGVGETNGLACGRKDDQLLWQPGRNVEIVSVNFPEGNEEVCNGGVVHVDTSGDGSPDSFQCTLKEPADVTPNRTVGFKFDIQVKWRGRTCQLFDPYVMISRR